MACADLPPSRQAAHYPPFSGSLQQLAPCPLPGGLGDCPLTESPMADSTTLETTRNGTSAPAAPQHQCSAAPAIGITALAAAEQANAYQSFGPAYIGTGITGDLSVELGITTGTGEKQQRSGIGIYLRSDHIAHRYASTLLI